MTFYLVIFGTSDSIITENKPHTFKDVVMSQSYEYRRDACFAQNAFYKGRAMAEAMAANSEKYAALEAEIDEYKANNKRLAECIDGLLGHQSVLINLNRACTGLLRRIMSQLAIGTIVQKTHRERNEQSRSIIRSVQYVLDKPVNEWSSPSIQEGDDIPF